MLMKNTEAAPESMEYPIGSDIERAKDFLATHNVQYILAQFVDMNGALKSKSMPADRLNSIVEEGAGFAGAAILGYGMKPNDQEYMMRGDLDTISLLPWVPGYARIMGTGMFMGKPHGADPRNILQAQLAKLAARGWTFQTGLEPEFMLLKRGEDGTISPFDSSDDLAKPAYDYRGLLRNRAFLERLVGSLQSLGLKVYQIDHEDAHGQYEVNFEFANALKSCDNMQIFKMAANEIAHEMGAICSFIPKLKVGSTGNGMHVHCSIADDQGRNLFLDETDESGMGLSALAYHFIAGIFKHARALTAILAPTVNSYKRLVLGTPESPCWAPVYVAYGNNNRSAMVRIPYGRIEIRTGDGAMNPYLATAAIIAAGLDGIDQKLTPGEMPDIDFFALSQAQLKEMQVGLLPTNLSEAIDALEADTFFAEHLGRDVIAAFVQIKRQEWRDYHLTVSAWETSRYLTLP
jgi:glutamine synthetase